MLHVCINLIEPNFLYSSLGYSCFPVWDFRCKHWYDWDFCTRSIRSQISYPKFMTVSVPYFCWIFVLFYSRFSTFRRYWDFFMNWKSSSRFPDLLQILLWKSLLQRLWIFLDDSHWIFFLSMLLRSRYYKVFTQSYSASAKHVALGCV